MRDDSYTEDFADIMSCARERRLALQILQAWDSGGLPDDFGDRGVKFAFNRSSGNVFLVNEDYHVAMMNGDRLETFYTSPYEGTEGFFGDLVTQYADMSAEDREWLRQVAEIRGEPLAEDSNG